MFLSGVQSEFPLEHTDFRPIFCSNQRDGPLGTDSYGQEAGTNAPFFKNYNASTLD